MAQGDVFAAGVILFTIVQGILPFNQASMDDERYEIFTKGDYDTYWTEVCGESLSDEFKDLVI